MRTFCLIVWLALESGCSTYRAHCAAHLRPINVPQTAVNGSRPAANGTAKGIRASAPGNAAESP